MTRTPEPVSSWKNERHFDDFVGRLSVKSRAAVEKHVEQCAASTTVNHGQLWKRLAGGLGSLAPFSTETVGQHALKYFIPDGKYRQQVFALEDACTGTIVVYLPDVIAKATETTLVAPGPDAQSYLIGHDHPELIHLEVITAESKDINHCKAMLGWGRRALRTTLSFEASEKQIRAVERLCEFAAQAWANLPQTPEQPAKSA